MGYGILSICLLFISNYYDFSYYCLITYSKSVIGLRSATAVNPTTLFLMPSRQAVSLLLVYTAPEEVKIYKSETKLMLLEL